MKPDGWVPLRWPSGPIDVARAKNLSSDGKALLDAPHQPDALKLLKAGPFNCLVVSWASGQSVDEEHRKTLGPLIAAARQQGLSIIGSVSGPAEVQISFAKAAGLDAVLTDGASALSGSIPVFSSSSPSKAGQFAGDLAAISGCDWPSVRAGRGGGADAGPTGYPWVDSNGWVGVLSRAQAPTKTLWTTAVPKTAAGPVRPEMYALAVADSAAFGTRWLVSLDEFTRSGLLKNDGESRETWSTLTKALRFFEATKPKSTGEVYTRLGILSDFAGPNERLAQEVLNLTIRRQLPSRILDPAKWDDDSARDLKAIVVITLKPPSGTLLKQLQAFAAGGGTVLLPPSAAHVVSGASSARTHSTGYSLFTSGDGKFAVAPKPWTSALATDAHRILSRSNDVVRLWNAGSSIAHPVKSGDRMITHILNYTGKPVGHPMSLWIALACKTARFTDLFGRSEMLEVKRAVDGSEVSLPPFTSYAAVEFGEHV